MIMDLHEEAERLKQRVMELYRRAISNEEELDRVAREIGGITLQVTYGAPETRERHAQILRAIAIKIIPSEWNYEIIESLGREPEIVLSGKTVRVSL